MLAGLTVFAAALGLAGSAEAQIFGSGSRTEFISGFGFRTFAAFLEANELLAGTEQLEDPLGRRFRARTTPISVVYGLRPRISLIAVVPIVDRELTESGPASGARSGAGTGLGDITVLAKWRFFKRDHGRGSWQLAVQGGLKLPTGKSGLRDSSGTLLAPGLQRGTGSWDPEADLIGAYTTPSGRWFFSGSVGGSLSTTGGDARRGNRFAYDGMIKARLTPLRSRDLFALLELNGRWQGRSRVTGVTIEDSGGHLLYLSPGLQYLVRPNVVVEAGAQFPVARSLNGVQLAPSFLALLGVRYIIVP